jgi:probable rRNA maturation factor
MNAAQRPGASEPEIEIEDEAWTARLPAADAIARRAAMAALASRSGASLVVLLTDCETVRELNARFRGKDAPTNVLAFPAGDHAAGHLGDIALALGVCEREAAEQAKPLADHLSHLVVHGVLHLLGYDHQDDAQAEAMESTERTILEGLGIADPYCLPAETTPDHG